MPYYLIRVPDIPAEGRDLGASSGTDTWFKKIVEEAISDEVHSFDATLSARIAKAGRSLEVIGGVYLKMGVACSRCLTDFDFEQQVPFRLVLEPAPQDKEIGGEAGERVENVSDSLDFSYYYGDEVDVGDLIRQHIMTAQLINHVCSEACKGLCPRCGKNLNKGPCGCKAESSESPFAALKQLKRRSP